MRWPASHARLLAASCRSSGNVLAVGDATGRIMLWHGVQNAVQARVAAQRGALNAEAADHAFKQMDARATMHWHAEPVRCLAFTADDSYLLSGRLPAAWAGCHRFLGSGASHIHTSTQPCNLPPAGGREGVLVVWDLSSGRRSYLPRLGAQCVTQHSRDGALTFCLHATADHAWPFRRV